MTTNDTRPTVLLVDDEPGLLELYDAWLSDICTVLTADGGEEALERVDESVDVAFLDRRMPDLSGDEVLAEMRARGHDCQVAMLTAVQPEEDIVDMPFDDYLTKPVDENDVKAVVDTLIERREYDERSQQLFSLASKRAALEASPDINHEASEEYQRLTERMERLRAELDDQLDKLMGHDYESAFKDIGS
jgi:DNA-binding response OmpR family regulator